MSHAFPDDLPVATVTEIELAEAESTEPSKYSKRFFVDLADRVASTVAQAALGVITVNATGIIDVDFAGVASVAALAGLVSVLQAFAIRRK